MNFAFNQIGIILSQNLEMLKSMYEFSSWPAQGKPILISYGLILRPYFESGVYLTGWVGWLYGCFLKWWYPQNTSKWSFFVGKRMVVGYHHFWKPPYSHNFVWCNHLFCSYMENVMTQPCYQGIVTCNQPTQCQCQSGPTSEAERSCAHRKKQFM